MGLRRMSRSSYCQQPIPPVQPISRVVPDPNPDPSNYKYIRTHEMPSGCVVELLYPDCTNYEGRKILVFKCKLVDVMNQRLIDPHFSDNKKYIHPFARFEPTEKGWRAAIELLRFI